MGIRPASALFGLLALLTASPALGRPVVSGNVAAVGHHSVIKVLQTDSLPADGMAPIVAKGAKGEFVDFQAFVAHAKGGSLSGVNVSLAEFKDAAGNVIPAPCIALFREHYLNVTKKTGPYGALGMFPDALVPIGPDAFRGEVRNGCPFDVKEGHNQGIWADVFIPPATPAGLYRSALTISAKDEPALAIPIELTVWNFTIPATSSIPAMFGGISPFDVSKGHLGPGKYASNAMLREMLPLYWQEAIRHRSALWGMAEAQGWAWDGKAIDWSAPHSYLGGGFDAIVGPYLDGKYPNARDPYLATGPQLPAIWMFSFDSGFRQDYSQPVTGKFPAPNPVTAAKVPDGKLEAGTWFYMVTSWVEGEGDSSPFFGPFKGEGNEVGVKLDAPGGVTLSWPVPAKPDGRKPSGFCIYRTPGPRSPSWEERLIATVRIKPEDATATFTDTGLECGEERPHYYNATARSELVRCAQAVAKHFEEKGWKGRAFAYMFDEPHDRRAFETVLWYAKVFRQAGLGVRPVCTTLLPDPWGHPGYEDFRRALVGELDTWCPNSLVFGQAGNRRIAGGYWPHSYREQQAKGRHVWFYDSNMSAGKPALQAGLVMDHPALTHRIRMWWAFRHEFEGYLYYASTMNFGKPDAWTSNPMTLGTNGDGALFYPGRPDADAAGRFSIGGAHHVPLPSIRLKMTRDSLQDYEYLALLSKRGQGAFAQEQLATVFAAPKLAKDATAEDDTIFLDSVEGLYNPKGQGWPPVSVFVEGECISYRDVDREKNALVQCFRGHFGSPAAAHKAGAHVETPPTNVLGKSLGDPSPLLAARERIGALLDTLAREGK